LWGARLKVPVVNRIGKAESISWPEALDHVAGRLRELIEAGKSVGVLGSPRATNEENYLAGKLARAGLQTNHVDFSYHSICRPLLAGVEEVMGEYGRSLTLHDLESSETILLIEGDLAKTHPRAACSVLKAVERGAHLIVLGHSSTQMAHLSSLHLQTAPGSEGEVINGLLAAALHPSLEDQLSGTVWCEGYEELRRDLAGIRATEEMRQAAEWIARAKRAAFLMPPTCGLGDQPRKDAAAFATLAAITGHLGQPGSGLLLLLGRSNVRGACDMGVAPGQLPGYRPFHDERSQQRLQDLWGKKLPSTRGMESESLLESVSGLIVLADDPPAVLPMGRRAAAAMERIEFIAVLDAFDTPTVRAAHAVLPIASFAETEGTITNMEGRIQRFHGANDPPGEARAGWEVLAELCARFEVGASYSSPADVLGEITQAAPRYAGVGQRLRDDGWSTAYVEDSYRGKLMLHATEGATLTSAQYPLVLACEGAIDWGRDPLVMFSPTLSRDYQSQHRLSPEGFVDMCRQDADKLGVSGGWRVKLTSAHGETVIPIRVKTDLKPGVLLVSQAFRDHVAKVLGTGSVAAVQAERA
jgi:predicted molibdopterin-dependent oxidoreductase YjgC